MQRQQQKEEHTSKKAEGKNPPPLYLVVLLLHLGVVVFSPISPCGLPFFSFFEKCCSFSFFFGGFLHKKQILKKLLPFLKNWKIE